MDLIRLDEAIKKLEDPHKNQQTIDAIKSCRIFKADTLTVEREFYLGPLVDKLFTERRDYMLGETAQRAGLELLRGGALKFTEKANAGTFTQKITCKVRVIREEPPRWKKEI